MMLTPNSWDDLAAALKTAGQDRAPIGRVNLSRLNRVRRYAPEDLTVTVESGITLGSLQGELRRHGQWLPIDPPGADDLSIAEILDRNLSGPRRHGHGTIREHLLGVRVALSDGRIIRSGGEVVKNVAGYDLMKLFVGAERSLGVIVEAAFKLLPVPAREVFVACPCASWDDAARCLECVIDSPVTPIVLDLHNVTPVTGRVATLVVGFAGGPEEVEWQLGQARELGLTEPASLEYAATFALDRSSPIQRWSVLPSRLIESLRQLGSAAFVARAGLGAIEHRGSAFGFATPAAPTPVLARRIKDTFDPAGILPAPPGLPIA